MGIRLNLEYDRDFFEKDEREWKNFAWYENKCGYTKLKEADTECKPELETGMTVSLEKTIIESSVVQRSNQGDVQGRSNRSLRTCEPNRLLRDNQEIP